jgi:hypothetical protein
VSKAYGGAFSPAGMDGPSQVRRSSRSQGVWASRASSSLHGLTATALPWLLTWPAHPVLARWSTLQHLRPSRLPVVGAAHEGAVLVTPS